MPHRKNPGEGHNPFDVLGNARTTTTTTTRVVNGQAVPKLKKIPQQARKSKRNPSRTAKQSAARSRRTRTRSPRRRTSPRKSTRKPRR